MSWSKKYKKSINCSNPKGFSQKAHCAGRKARQSGNTTKSKSVNEMKISDLKEQIRSVIRERSVKAIQKEYQKVIDDMQSHLDMYKKSKGTPNEKKHIDALKTLTTQKKKLQSELDSAVAGLYKNAELKVDESINEIEYKDAVEKFNADLMKNSQVERIAKFHKRSIKDVVKALQPYLKVLRYSDKSIKVISIDFRDTNSDVKVHVSQTYKQNESVTEGKLGDTWRKNNKKGYILKVGNIELKSAGPSNSHDILVDRMPWGTFMMDYEAGGDDWWVKPLRGKDFWVDSIDDLVKRVKADSRFK